MSNSNLNLNKFKMSNKNYVQRSKKKVYLGIFFHTKKQFIHKMTSIINSLVFGYIEFFLLSNPV